jgi:hypothetical protein
MTALFASFFSLFVGPLVYQTFGRLERTDKIASGIVLTLVGGMILVHVLPEAYKTLGYWAVLLAFIGFEAPTLLEKSFRKSANTTHILTMVFGLLGILTHAMIDGIALQADQQNDSANLTVAIIMHRLPVGLTIWWMLKPLIGERYALGFLALMGVATLIGYASSESMALFQNHFSFAVLQAIVAGSLLHVIIHKPHSDGCMHTSHEHHAHHHSHSQKQQNVLVRLIFRWENLGYLVGLLLLFVGIESHTHVH